MTEMIVSPLLNVAFAVIMNEAAWWISDGVISPYLSVKACDPGHSTNDEFMFEKSTGQSLHKMGQYRVVGNQA